MVTDVGECGGPLEYAEEGVLDDVLGLGAGVEEGVGDAEQQGGVCLDESGEVGLGLRELGLGALDGRQQCQAFLERCHRGVLS